MPEDGGDLCERPVAVDIGELSIRVDLLASHIDRVDMFRFARKLPMLQKPELCVALIVTADAARAGASKAIK